MRTLTPCIQAIAEVIFEKKFEEVVGPYCCAQFMVCGLLQLARQNGNLLRWWWLRQWRIYHIRSDHLSEQNWHHMK